MQLVLTEKPSVAQSIAKVICHNAKRNDGYIEDRNYLVTWCVGHLVELASPQEYDDKYRRWSLDTLPVIPEEWKYLIKPETKKQFNTIKTLMGRKDVESVICATDAGREGELIFRLVYEQAQCRKPMKRLWISSMEESSIKDGFKNLKPGAAYDNLYQSALCRQRSDWLIGMNGTRFFTTLYGGRVLNVGRVQTPTLSMIVDRDSEIKNFQKEAYYQVELSLGGFKAISEKIKDKVDAEHIAGICEASEAVIVSVTKDEKSIAAPKLFDLTSLQREANKLFGFTAKETLEITQKLYEAKLVTYPRTDSQYLSDDMAETASRVLHAIHEHISFVFGNMNVGMNCGRIPVVLDSKKVTDHHAIIPTVEIAKGMENLSASEKKILFLTACRLLCATGEKHKYIVTKAELSCGGNSFTIQGREVTYNGWKDFEDMLKNYFRDTCNTNGGSNSDESESETRQLLPSMKEGDIYKVENSESLEKFTKAPAHYTESTILTAMEKAGANETTDEAERKGLGTPATRADILEKLVRDGYVHRDKKQLLATEDGINIIRVLPDKLKSPVLTAEWENELSNIAKGTAAANVFMDSIKTIVTDIVGGSYIVSETDKALFARTFDNYKKSSKDRDSFAKKKTKYVSR